MKTQAKRRALAVWRWIKTPTGLVAGALLIMVAGAIASTLLYKGHETMQLAVRTDVLHVRTAGPLVLEPVFARSVRFSRIKTLTVPGAPEKALGPDDICSIESAPPQADAPAVTPSPAGLTFQFDAGEEVTFRRQREAKQPSLYTVRVDPIDPVAGSPAPRITLTLQRGQQVLLNGERLETGALGGQVVVLGTAGFQVTFSAAQPDASHLSPASIRGIGFLRPQGGSLGLAAPRESGVISGDLAFLSTPGESVSLRQGADLILEGLDATLQSVSFAEDAVVANASGEVEKASLQVGRATRVVQPTWFDYLLGSRIGRAIIGVIAALVGLLGNIEKLHGHAKAMRGENDPERRRTAEE